MPSSSVEVTFMPATRVVAALHFIKLQVLDMLLSCRLCMCRPVGMKEELACLSGKVAGMVLYCASVF